jgi:hypothetical protein
MPRTIDLIRASRLPSNMMQFAAKGALSVPPEENLEILVHLAKHNKVFGDLARMTLAGWDEKASLAAASNPKTPHEVLEYLISPENLRPKLFPALLENPCVQESLLVKFALSASRESIEVMLQSRRVQASPAILNSLRSNPYLKPEEAKTVTKLTAPGRSQAVANSSGVSSGSTTQSRAPVQATSTPPSSASVSSATDSKSFESIPGSEIVEEGEEVSDETVAAYLAENAVEISAEQNKPFQAVGGMVESFFSESSSAPENMEEIDHAPAADTAAATKPTVAAAAAVAKAALKPAAAQPQRRENTLQKINNLDVKGRIQLALKGNKEERSILIRDGTKVVALAVLEAPKLSDGEVEKFALQKNVLEAVLRQIPLKRRFMKNYVVVRNLVSNPRTPLDLSLGLMKHLLTQDLKNLSANKEVSETVRKLALKMYKQKMEAANKPKT